MTITRSHPHMPNLLTAQLNPVETFYVHYVMCIYFYLSILIIFVLSFSHPWFVPPASLTSSLLFIAFFIFFPSLHLIIYIIILPHTSFPLNYQSSLYFLGRGGNQGLQNVFWGCTVHFNMLIICPLTWKSLLQNSLQNFDKNMLVTHSICEYKEKGKIMSETVKGVLGVRDWNGGFKLKQ